MEITEGRLAEVQIDEKHLMELILSPYNMNRAYRKVVSNGGSGGVDSMETKDLLPYLKLHNDELRNSILNGKYKPMPVRRVEIPKDNGKTRKLGIPTLVDRVIQQSIAQVLTPMYEPQFSEGSYGFRPNRSAQGALRQAQKILDEGYEYAVGIDLERFFDTVNQSYLIELLSHTIKDGRVISLIHKYLYAGVMVNGVYQPTTEGTPQGGPLSPLLSNIVLNELDKELERRGHPFVRYADDSLIFCKSKRGAERVCDQVHREETPPESKPRQDGSQLCPWDEVPRTYLLQDWRGLKVVCPFQEPVQTEGETQDADGQEQRDGI